MLEIGCGHGDDTAMLAGAEASVRLLFNDGWLHLSLEHVVTPKYIRSKAFVGSGAARGGLNAQTQRACALKSRRRGHPP